MKASVPGTPQATEALIAALEVELRDHGIALPIYFGNRNWHPLLAGTLRTMRAIAGNAEAGGGPLSGGGAFVGSSDPRVNAVLDETRTMLIDGDPEAKAAHAKHPRHPTRRAQV